MTENDNTMDSTSTKSSGMKPTITLVIGGIVILFVIGLTIMFFAKKAAPAAKTDLTLTDTKTGQTTNVGGEKLPDTFPKDFPIYQGAKVVSSVSSAQQEKGKGLLVTFTTPDGLDKIVPFYKSGLNTSAWAITSSFDSDTIQTWTIAKGTTEGSVSITSQKDQTTIQVELRDKE